MPTRYTAYAIGNVDFIMKTTHPGGPQWNADRASWKAELVAYCRAIEFVGLRVLEHEIDEAAGRAFVTFRAELARDGAAMGFSERSLFVREDGVWLYHSGEESA